MNDLKNIFLAWASSISSIFTAIEAKTLIAIISAIVLPVIFFSIGKAIDVALQVYFRRRDERKCRSEKEASGKSSINCH